MVKKSNGTIKNLFGSTTRIKLLELFFTNFDKNFYVREITRIINEQINSVRRELANLEQIGVVKKTDRDNKVYYRVNQKFSHYLAFAMIFDENFDQHSLSRSTIRELEKEANVAPQPSDDKFDWQKIVARSDDYLQIVILAGKLVPDSESGVDILLVGDNSKQEVSAWATRAEKAFGASLAYSVMPYDEFIYRHSIRDRFIMQFLTGPYVVVKDLTGTVSKEEE